MALLSLQDPEKAAVLQRHCDAARQAHLHLQMLWWELVRELQRLLKQLQVQAALAMYAQNYLHLVTHTNKAVMRFLERVMWVACI